MGISEQLANEAKFKFCICFHLPEQMVSSKPFKESYYIENGIDVDGFRKLLIKNDMEEYSDLLLSRLYAGSLSNQLRIEERSKQKNSDASQYKKDLTETLLFLLSNNAGSNSSVTFQKQRNRFTILNKDIIEDIIKGLIEEYEKNSFNEGELTVEEAEEEIKLKSDPEWIANWLMRYGEEVDPYFNDGIDYYISNDMILGFAESHYFAREVNLEFLEKSFKENFTGKNKAGAKSKNTDIASLMRHLSYLIRIDKYLNQKLILDFDKFPLSSKDCRFIYDCFIFFNLIDKSINIKKPENYIRTTLIQTRISPWDHRPEKIRVNINLLKAQKDSEFQK